MRTIYTTRTVEIPEGVEVDVKARKLTVKGPKGQLVREFKHLNLDIQKEEGGNIKVDLWFGGRANISCIRTVCSHITNMITGVTKGFRYKVVLPSTPHYILSDLKFQNVIFSCYLCCPNRSTLHSFYR